MRKDKEKAISLRRSGKSFNEIKASLGIPKATLSDWFNGEPWSAELASELSAKAQKVSALRLKELGAIRGERLKSLYRQAEQEAREEFEVLKFSPLFIAGVALYWGEGDKATRNCFRISNSDPSMIKLFADFLLKVCGAQKERIKAALVIYPDLDESSLKNHWSSAIGLEIRQFTKTMVIQGRHPTKRTNHGVCIINFSSTYLKRKMLVWIDLLSKI